MPPDSGTPALESETEMNIVLMCQSTYSEARLQHRNGVAETPFRQQLSAQLAVLAKHTNPSDSTVSRSTSCVGLLLQTLICLMLI